MADFYLQWLAITLIQAAATMSPGPAFVVAVKNAATYGRKTGIFTSIGLALGVAAHVGFVLIGISFIIAQSAILFSFIKYAGAAYLCYIGIKALCSKSKTPSAEAIGTIEIKTKELSVRHAILTGFLTNLLNPKAVIFFTAVFSQFIGPNTPVFVGFVYGTTSCFIEFIWFATLSIVLTNSYVKKKFVNLMNYVEKICGGLMIALGAKLALSR